jgi:hypothetical protein
MRRIVLEQKLGFAATVCSDGTPNLSPKGTTTVWDDEHLVFADISSPQTVRNLRGNPSIEINVVDPIVRKGYRFKGKATLCSEGDVYERGLALLAERGYDARPERVCTVVIINEPRSYVGDQARSRPAQPVCHLEPSRKPSARALAVREFVKEAYAAREGYRSVYGVRKTWKELRRRDIDVGRNHVARLMRQEGLEGVHRDKKRRTTIVDAAALERTRDLLQRDFVASRRDEKWVADMTYICTWNGFVYLAFVLDCYSRMIVGWQLATHLRTDLVLVSLPQHTFMNGGTMNSPGVVNVDKHVPDCRS